MTTPARTPLILLGGGGHAAVVADCATRTSRFSIAFAADTEPRDLCALHAAVWLGEVSAAKLAGALREGARLHAAVGDGELRMRWLTAFGAEHFDSIIDPSAVVSTSASLGAGTFIASRAIVNARATIGAACIINSGAIVEHDCVLEDGVHVSPGSILCGTVCVGTLTHIGAGAVVLPGIRIGARVRVGAGAVVTKDVADDATVVGVPARTAC